MMLSNKDTTKARKSYKYWLRLIHRNLGFFMVGICFIYGISGFLLNHMDGKDPAYSVQEKSVSLGENLQTKDVIALWGDEKNLPKLNKILEIDNQHYRLLFSGGVGVYDTKTGTVEYEIYTQRKFVYWINKLHYNKVKGWTIMADLFAISLIFFAISGVFMVSRKNGLLGTGKYYIILGLFVPIIYIVLV